MFAWPPSAAIFPAKVTHAYAKDVLIPYILYQGPSRQTSSFSPQLGVLLLVPIGQTGRSFTRVKLWGFHRSLSLLRTWPYPICQKESSIWRFEGRRSVIIRLFKILDRQARMWIGPQSAVFCEGLDICWTVQQPLCMYLEHVIQIRPN